MSKSLHNYKRAVQWALLFVVACLAFACHQAYAQQIPESSAQYRLRVERASSEFFGLNAPTARLAAQIHQESGWRERAQSPYAMGLTQFTPSTAKWLPEVCPTVDAPDPWNANWAIRAQACYMQWLHARVRPLGRPALNECSRWAFALRAYNGGETMLARERRMALAANQDANAWTIVARYRVRASWAHKENTDYPRRILLKLEPLYLNTGWPGQSVCEV